MSMEALGMIVKHAETVATKRSLVKYICGVETVTTLEQQARRQIKKNRQRGGMRAQPIIPRPMTAQGGPIRAQPMRARPIRAQPTRAQPTRAWP